MKNIGVVIPVYNQALPLLCTLHGFMNQNISLEHFKIVVVDDGSTEDIETICNLFRTKLDITYIRIIKSGRSISRNEGVRKLKDSDIITFCDADRIPVPGFLQNHLFSHEKSEEDSIVIGNIKDLYLSDPWNNMTKIFNSYFTLKGLRTPQYSKLVYKLFDEKGESISNVPWLATFSGNMSIRLDLFKKLKGFDPDFRHWGFEHFELGYRAYKLRTPFAYNAKATNIHISHSRYSYKNDMGESHRIFYKKHPFSEIKNIKKFMNGEMSLNEFNQLSEGNENKRNLPDEYVKITNF
ncbi:glycosyltransferase family 2 protein [Oceanobacillus profundus]|uniref:Glycosyltransferase n=1 Tax=Oceanobacillus profundus TaxID=372463 RepID=A0A417YI55_9BACI|nr:glycosyltransferase family 2 protein [Oceanobacillus profundus]MCM3399726.1 glycosyltransferase [Oceanobacillus profundus]MDO6450022.1 glycosyltransferase [Oceanobacillus profundus]PAE28235.1 hypothetical protein CHI07_15750 [Paenibacillus sp. 7884-2]RHW32539.1 glycosyltransferase [Oceanobacillus profundus]